MKDTNLEEQFGNSLEPVMVFDVNTMNIEFVNTACRRFLGIGDQDSGIENMDLKKIFQPSSEVFEIKHLFDLLKTTSEIAASEIPVIPVNGAVRKCGVRVGYIDKGTYKIYFVIEPKFKHDSGSRILEVEQYAQIVKHFPEPIVVLILDNHLTLNYANQAFNNIFSIGDKEFANVFQGRFGDAMLPTHKSTYTKEIARQVHSSGKFEIEIKLYDVEGNVHTTMFSGVELTGSESRKVYCQLNVVDEKVKLIEELEIERKMFDSVYSLSNDLLFRLNLENNQIRYFGSSAKDFGLGPVMENFPYFIIDAGIMHKDDQPAYLKMYEDMCNGIETPTLFRVTNIRGEELWYQCEYIIANDNYGVPKEAIGIIVNKQEEKELEEKVSIDPLTGCLTKAVFEKKVSELLKNEKGANTHFMFIIDVDNFKAINDNLGHQFGDIVLKEVGEKLRNIFRESDLVGRVGGDEFMVFLKNINDYTIMKSKVERVLSVMDNSYEGHQRSYRITGSIGVSAYPKDGSTFEKLYINADTALYATKNKGKNNYTFYDDNLSKGTMENTTAFDVANRTLSQHFDQDLISDIYNLLFETSDFELAMKAVVRRIATRFSVHNSYVYKLNTDTGNYDGMYNWIAKDIVIPPEYVLSIPNEIVMYIKSHANYEGVYYCNDITTIESEPLRAYLEKINLKSFLQVYVKIGETDKYLIGFDDFYIQRAWSPIEMSTLIYTSKIFAQFLEYKESIETTRKIAKENIDVMENLNFPGYIVDVNTFELLHINEETVKNVPVVKIGDICYKVLRGKTSVCEDCLIHDMRRDNVDRVKKIVYNDFLKQDLVATGSFLESFCGKRSMLVTTVDISSYIDKSKRTRS